MLKSALWRQARLGYVATRRVTALTSQSGRLSSLAQISQLPSSSVVRQTSTRLLSARFYSAEATAQEERRDGEDNSPSSSGLVTSFAELPRLGVHNVLVRSIVDGMNYENMTEVQSMTINSALAGKDLVAQARTGTGKTLAFLVPIVQRIIDSDPSLAIASRDVRARPDDIRAIILSPTRELAEQIGTEARKLLRGTGIVVQTAVGGTQKSRMLRQTQAQGCHLMVATPGRLHDLLSDRYSGIRAPMLSAFVLDEADRMLDVGFSQAIQEIQDLLPDPREVQRQTLLFSATIPRDVIHLAKSMVNKNNFEFVQTIKQDEAPTHEKVPQHVVSMKGYENFFPSLIELANKAIAAEKTGEGQPFKAIAFFPTTAQVEFAHQVLSRTNLARDLPMFDIHSKLSQQQRTRNAAAFRKANSAILISSDVTARGMDFPNVSHVIQFGVPQDRDSYIHRIGRTGRASKSGEAWIFLHEAEIPEARDRLYDLPIKPNQTIVAAQHSMGSGTPPAEVQPYFDDVTAASRRSQRSFEPVYMAALGMKQGRHFKTQDIVDCMNAWAINGVGLETPPTVSPSAAAKRGLSRVRGINVGHSDHGRRDRDAFDNNFDSFDSSFRERGSRGGREQYNGRGSGNRHEGGRSFGEGRRFGERRGFGERRDFGRDSDRRSKGSF